MLVKQVLVQPSDGILCSCGKEALILEEPSKSCASAFAHMLVGKRGEEAVG